jgi:hypothetical protein
MLTISATELIVAMVDFEAVRVEYQGSAVGLKVDASTGG